MRPTLFALLLAAALAPPASPTSAERAFLGRLANAALARTKPPTPKVTYDPSYVALRYPGGDVPADRGVCADVVVRSYHAVGIDLQKELHEDMAAHFDAYPKRWGLSRPDPNIDHRRVPNLARFFERHGVSLGPSHDARAFLPGDVVTWIVPPNLPHIGIVSPLVSRAGVPLVVHDIGRGDVVEDALFAFEMTGHYRYFGRVLAPG